MRSSADAEIFGKLRVQRTCVAGCEGAGTGLRLRLRPDDGGAAGISSAVVSPVSDADVVRGATSRRITGGRNSFLTMARACVGVSGAGAGAGASVGAGAGEAVLVALARGGRPRGRFSFSFESVRGIRTGLRGSKAGATGDLGALGVPGVATGVHLVALPVLKVVCLEAGVPGRVSLSNGLGRGVALTSGARPLLGLYGEVYCLCSG